jgi:hypothetical protein
MNDKIIAIAVPAASYAGLETMCSVMGTTVQAYFATEAANAAARLKKMVDDRISSQSPPSITVTVTDAPAPAEP